MGKVAFRQRSVAEADERRPSAVVGLAIMTNVDILPESAAGPAYDADCRRCARLATFLDRVREANPGYFCRPVPPFGASDARAGDRRARAGNARRERERPAVHRRLRGDPAVRDAVRLRLRVAAGRDRARRRPRAHRLPDHQRGEMPAAGQQAGAGRDSRLQRVPGGGSRSRARGRRDPRRSAASRTMRRSRRSA